MTVKKANEKKPVAKAGAGAKTKAEKQVAGSQEQGTDTMEEQGDKDLKDQETQGTEQGAGSTEEAGQETQSTEQGAGSTEEAGQETHGTEQGAGSTEEAGSDKGDNGDSRDENVGSSKEQPCISVVIVLGAGVHESMLSATLNSLLVQDTDLPFEVIVVNNQADAAKSALFSELCQVGARFVELENPVGLAGAMNHALQECRGDYVANLYPGDAAESSWLSEMMAFMKDGDTKELKLVAGCQIKFFGEQEGRVSKHPLKQTKKEVQAYPPGYFWITNFPGSVMRKDFILELGGYTGGEDDDLPVDFPLWCKVLKAGYAIYTHPKVLVNYFFKKKQGVDEKKRWNFLNKLKLGLK